MTVQLKSTSVPTTSLTPTSSFRTCSRSPTTSTGTLGVILYLWHAQRVFCIENLFTIFSTPRYSYGSLESFLNGDEGFVLFCHEQLAPGQSPIRLGDEASNLGPSFNAMQLALYAQDEIQVNSGFKLTWVCGLIFRFSWTIRRSTTRISTPPRCPPLSSFMICRERGRVRPRLRKFSGAPRWL